MAALRNLAEYCEYGDTLDAILKDRIVCGVWDEKTTPACGKEIDLPVGI